MLPLNVYLLYTWVTVAMVLIYFILMNNLNPGMYTPTHNGFKPLIDYIRFQLFKNKFIDFVIKVNLIIYYCISFWVFHTYAGATLYVISFSIILYIPIELLPSWIQTSALLYCIIGLGTGINLYLAVQFQFVRDMLRDMVGVQAFSEIIGDNPGTAQYKTLIVGTAGVVGAAGLIVLGEPIVTSIASSNIIAAESTAATQRATDLINGAKEIKLHELSLTTEQLTKVIMPPVQNAEPHYPHREHFMGNVVKVLYDINK